MEPPTIDEFLGNASSLLSSGDKISFEIVAKALQKNQLDRYKLLLFTKYREVLGKSSRFWELSARLFTEQLKSMSIDNEIHTRELLHSFLRIQRNILANVPHNQILAMYSHYLTHYTETTEFIYT